jgi:hypothetical protein
MQIHLREIGRDRGEEIIVEADRRGLRILLLLAGSCWLTGSVWIVRGIAFQNAAGGPDLGPSTVALWLLTAIVLAGAVGWTLFGRRVVSFNTHALSVHRAIGPLRIGRLRTYSLANVCNLRMESRGVNDGGWKTTERTIMFDYRNRTLSLFAHVPAHASERLLSRAQALTNVASQEVTPHSCATCA